MFDIFTPLFSLPPSLRPALPSFLQGDITINPSATCLIMTTEILRSMLYRGSEIMREVAWVVYDEIHYMRDKDRGVVWEVRLLPSPPRPLSPAPSLPPFRVLMLSTRIMSLVVPPLVGLGTLEDMEGRSRV